MQREEACQIVRVIRQQVPRGWNDVPVVGNVDLRFNGLVARHVLREECRKEEICERWGARKIQIVIRWLGTRQGVKYAGQVVNFEYLKVKFEWLKEQRSVHYPKDTESTDALQGNVPRLAKHEDFGSIFEEGGSQISKKRACTRLEPWHVFFGEVSRTQGLLRV